ncbi:phage tail protein [Escherichia coli]|nr:phage tail protein [Escherichia coli]EFJ1631682.1 phage tail protein [Escherichia coli]
MMTLLIVAEQYGLNPFTREIYAFPDKQNGIIPVVGVDGWSRIINEHPQYDGVEFVYSDKMVRMQGAKVDCPEWIECVIYRKDRSRLTHMAVGDGGGVLPTPDSKQAALVNEKRRAALNMLYIDPQNSSQIIDEQVIPENEGGWWIREVGLFDESGALIAVGNCPESYKPQLAEGSGRTQTVRMVLITSSTDNITLKIDPAVVLATRKYVDDKALELKVYADDQMAKHLAAPDPHSQYAPKESPTFTGTPKAPTPAAGNNTTQIATTEFVQAALTALINGAPATLDTLKEIAAAINNDPKFSTTINNALALKAPLSSPALTGTPTAPTAAQSVNNTQIATTAFVKSAIAAMVGSAPAALDTLNELAAALGNDPNFATTMLNALAGKQPLDNTLTNLSGKDVTGLLTYLRL